MSFVQSVHPAPHPLIRIQNHVPITSFSSVAVYVVLMNLAGDSMQRAFTPGGREARPYDITSGFARMLPDQSLRSPLTRPSHPSHPVLTVDFPSTHSALPPHPTLKFRGDNPDLSAGEMRAKLDLPQVFGRQRAWTPQASFSRQVEALTQREMRVGRCGE